MMLTVEELERRLASIPTGSTLRQAQASDGASARRAAAPMPAPRWDGIVPPPLDLPCAVSTCSNRVAHPGICDRCGAEQEDADAREQFKAARDSVPEFFRWASCAAPEFDKRVSAILGTTARPSVMAERIARDLLAGGAKAILVKGARNSGKTSLVCGVADYIVSAAMGAWIRHQRELREADRRAAPAEPRICAVGRGLLFVAARNIAPPKDRDPDAPPPMYARALRSRLLILDELGQEIEAREDTATTSSRLKSTSDLVSELWDRNVPILITTPLNEDQILRIYGGGVQKRICKAEQTRVVELGSASR